MHQQIGRGAIVSDMTLTTGQELWWEPSDPRDKKYACIVKITKIGRDWIYLSNNQRVSISTLIADPGKYSPSGQCYISKEVRELEVKAESAFTKIKHKMSNIPPGVSYNDIVAAAKLLKLDI
jgi:hypothetical protein